MDFGLISMNGVFLGVVHKPLELPASLVTFLRHVWVFRHLERPLENSGL